jgi:hypothetical protein
MGRGKNLKPAVPVYVSEGWTPVNIAVYGISPLYGTFGRKAEKKPIGTAYDYFKIAIAIQISERWGRIGILPDLIFPLKQASAREAINPAVA